MSTNDVPGANPANGDNLAIGCWAEALDGSLILVESAEQNRIIFSMFDMAQMPIIEYRDAMLENEFKKAFSISSGKSIGNIRWTWHDKTPFPWDRIIKSIKPGPKYASAEDQLSAAARVAQSLNATARNIAAGQYDHMADNKSIDLSQRIQRALRAFLDG